MFLLHTLLLTSLFVTRTTIQKYGTDLHLLNNLQVPDSFNPLASLSHLSQQQQHYKSHEPIISNIGETATFMLAWPSIATFTLVQGWNQDKTEKLRQAVKTVMERNPILSGRAQWNLSQTFFPKVEISIIPNAFDITKHDFFQELHLSKGPLRPMKDLSEKEILSLMDQQIAPLLQKQKSVFELIQSKSPLFHFHLIHLPETGYACYVMQMSHCIGDGVTYYNIMNEIHHIFNDDPKLPIPIDWRHESIASHEVFPLRFSRRDKDRAYGFPFFIGILKNVWNMAKDQKIQYIILDKRRVQEMRKSLASNSDAYLSANDVITSALCEANKSSDIFAFTMDMRGLHNRHLGGNFHNEIPFARKGSTDANRFRKILKRGFYYDTNRLPLCPFIFGKVGRISNIATVQRLIESEDVKVLCHSMLSAFVDNVPLDTAFICSMNKDQSYVILHNFRDIDLDRGLIRYLKKE